MTRRLRWIALATAVTLAFAWGADAQYKARPIITALEPSAGPPGSQIKIVGKDFGPEYKVYYNGVELQPISVSATEIVVQLPANAVQGRFTLRGPIHQVVSPQVFWVVQAQVAPVVTGITPAFGPPGTVITVMGKHFSTKPHENAVTLGGVPLQVRSSSEARIEAVVPPGAATGNITVHVFNAGQATSQQAFTVLAQLMVDSIQPAAGPPGSRVTLRGSGFSVKKGDNAVTLAGKPCKVLQSNSSEIVVQIPVKDAETGRFRIDVKGLGTIETAAVFPVAFPPEITGFSPESGGLGQEVAITGVHFGTNPQVVQITLTGRACQVLAVSDKEIRALVPQGAVSGPFEVIIEQLGSAASPKTFEVWAPLAVTRMEPLYGLPGAEIRLWGTGFRSSPGDHTVAIGSETVPVQRIENGALVFKIPENAPDGQVVLRLEVKDRGATMIAMPLNLAHTPVITDFTPKRGPVGTLLTVTGNYFGTQPGHVRVLIGGRLVQASEVTPTTIRLVIPQGGASGPVEVQTVRRGNAKSTASFETFVPVLVTNFLPSMGYPGQLVSLFGNGFDTVAKRNTVTLAGIPCPVMEASASLLKIKLPKGIQTGRFRVEVPERGFSESPLEFTIVEQLNVKSFAPPSGIPGAYVVIKGKGFQNKGLRGYIGQKPMGVRVDSPTQVTIAVPPGAVDGPFVFTAPGAGRSESTTKFKVLTPLTITGFQPTFGPAGTKVSVYGTGFSLNPKRIKVAFSGQRLNIEAGSNEAMLIVTIPKGATVSPFQVTVKEMGQVESENVFTVVEPTPTPQPMAVAAPPPTTPTAVQPVAIQPAPAPSPYGGAPAAQPAAAQPAAQPGAAAGPPASMDDLMGIPTGENAPKINSLDTTEGPAGEVLTINGSGFGEDVTAVKAWIGQAPANVVGVVPDMVMIEIPVGVKRGKIRLKVGSFPTISSEQLFTVTE